MSGSHSTENVMGICFFFVKSSSEMRLPMKCMVFLACWALALATPAKIGDGDLGGAKTGSVVDSSHRDSKCEYMGII
ncbi:hypothetical protein FHG87_012220 [Trinorchestia longiramus]|nr:hypothetical protein FHG87_012220 [Trinorchestia longiramus]